MINAELEHVTSLEEFYKEIVRQQTDAHGTNYCIHHRIISTLMKECDSYLELGTHQGATAACAILQNPKSVQLVDIDFTKYNKFLKPIAEQYCKDNNIALNTIEDDSSKNTTTSAADFLLIDSRHIASHMTAELKTHSKNISKYILAHDTHRQHGKINTSLYTVLENFCKTNPWKVVERNTTAEGYTLLERL